jgi:hypothetical protein
MNILLKSAVAGALALSASGAFALGTPAMNSSDLVLIVQDVTKNTTYAYDTGVDIDSVFQTSGLHTGAVMDTTQSGLSKTINATSMLSSFLAAAGSDTIGWTIEASQYNGGTPTTNSTLGNSHAPGAAKAIFTSMIGTTNNGVLAGKVLGSLTNFGTNLNSSLNSGEGADGLGLQPLQSATESTSASYNAGAATKYGFIGVNDLGATGTSYQLFGFTGNNTAAVLQSYILGSATLSANGTLTIKGNSAAPVPLPAAVWLFGSGLMGLVGVSRRRKTAVAV